jgi:hypothetical protein
MLCDPKDVFFPLKLLILRANSRREARFSLRARRYHSIMNQGSVNPTTAPIAACDM